jgi:4-amino-4-deoxyprephenate dehydrogenase
LTHTLDELRALIMAEDQQIIEHLAARMNLVRQVGELKRDSAIAVMQPGQVAAVLDRAAARADEYGLPQQFARDLFSAVIAEACRVEEAVLTQAGVAAGRDGQPAEPATALIIGGLGHAAAVLMDWLHRLGVSCIVTDGRPSAAADFTADATRPSARLRAAVRASEIVVLATPHQVSVACLAEIGPLLAEDAVLVDLLSVKSGYARALADLGLPCSAVGLNPMYGPGLSPARPHGLAVQLQPGPPATRLLAGLDQAGVSLLRLATAADHDRICAQWQALPHAAVLSFGAALHALHGEASAAARDIAPPPFRALCALLGRMLALSPETYSEVQEQNPFAAEARATLAEAVAATVSAGTSPWLALREQAGHAFSDDGPEIWAPVFQRLANSLLDGTQP